MKKFCNSEVHTQYCRLFFLSALLLVVSYSNTFHVSWQLDDKPNILTNSYLQITDLSLDQLLQSMHARPGSGDLYRPIACLSLALNWYFGKRNVFGYHVVNFLIHLATSWILFLTIINLFFTPRLKGLYPREQITFIAITATLLWALNPIQTQAVTYIVQRMASMAGMFAILSIYFYLKGRLSPSSQQRSLLLAACAVSYILALMSKENAASLILIAPVLELLFFQPVSSGTKFKKFISISTGSLLICVLAGLALRPETYDFIVHYYDNRPFTLQERFLTEQRILPFYLSQLLFPAPSRLSIEHDITLSSSIFDPYTTIPAIAINILLFLLASLIGRRQPFFSLAILFFYINHLIESTIVPLELIFEHRNYLPSLFLFIPVAQILNSSLVTFQKNRIIFYTIFTALSLLLATEGYATYTRNKVWQTEESLWIDALTKAPNSARPLATLAIKLAWGDNPTEKKYRKALELTKKTLTMKMSRKLLDAAQLGNAASIHKKLGEYQQAVDYYNQALAISPENANIRYNLVKTYVIQGNFDEAEKELEIIISNGYVHPDYFNMSGFINLWLGHTKKALTAARKALSYAPNRPDILLTLARSISLAGYYDRAEWFFNMARREGGENSTLSLGLIENSLLKGDRKMAQAYLRHALKQHPLPEILDKLADPTKYYSEIPLNTDILKPFIAQEISSRAETLQQ